MMKVYQKEFIQNKGSALLSCIISIFFILTIFGIILINSSILNSVNHSNETLLRIFEENRINDLYYQEGYTITKNRYTVCGDIVAIYMYNSELNFHDANGTYKHIYTYEYDDENNLILTHLEVYGE